MTAFNAITTLNEIREHSPCEKGWEKLLAHLGKTKADDEQLHLLTILNSNGLDDAVWYLRAKSLERLSRHFQAWCAEQVLHLFEAERPGDMRVRDQIAMLRNDHATDEERDAARSAAWNAALGAAGSAARNAAGAAARFASWNAALDAAWAAVWAAARSAAWDAARSAQERQLRAMIEEVTQ